MLYHDGSPVRLGDLVDVPVPSGTARARVVMLGDTYEHLEVEAGFLSWVKTEKILRNTAVVVEWLGESPLAHDDPQYAPVGNYMFTDVDEHVVHASNRSFDAHTHRQCAARRVDKPAPCGALPARAGQFRR